MKVNRQKNRGREYELQLQDVRDCRDWLDIGDKERS